MNDPATVMQPLHKRIGDYLDIRLAQAEHDVLAAERGHDYTAITEAETRRDELRLFCELIVDSKRLMAITAGTALVGCEL